MSDIKCSFFGHRKIEVTEELKNRVTEIVENLIVQHNVQTFLFGSRSNFDTLCHLVVTELKEKYVDLKRVCYTCRHETCVLESERAECERIYGSIYKREVHLLGVEEEREHKTKYTSAKASYVERNQAMICDSDFCVFDYDENYQPEMRQYSKRSVFYQPKSGTALAYKFAMGKRKVVINLFETKKSWFFNSF